MGLNLDFERIISIFITEFKRNNIWQEFQITDCIQGPLET